MTMDPASSATCPHCQSPDQTGLFCRTCGRYMADGTGTVERVTHTRRFFGDWLLESLLVTVTLFVGWLIWLYFTAKTSQTPAKRLLNVYIIDAKSGEPISAGRVWVRDVLVKIVLVTLANFVAGIAGLVNGGWVLIDKDRQALHDKLVGTVVVYAPAGLSAEMTTPTSTVVG